MLAAAQAAWYANGSATDSIRLLDMYARGPYPGGTAGYQQSTSSGISWLEFAWNDYFLFNYPMCPAMLATVFGYMTPVPLSTANSTVCVLNCGPLPWSFSRTYATAMHNATATFAPYQAFSLAFPGINTAAFQTNNHVTFDRDQFLQRCMLGTTQPTCVVSHRLALKPLPKHKTSICLQLSWAVVTPHRFVSARWRHVSSNTR